MPTYEYRCNGCKRELEVQQKMADDDLVHCEVCGEDKLEKLISWTSVRGGSWGDALYSSNPRAALKGTTAFDRSTSSSSATSSESAGGCGAACACAAAASGSSSSDT